MPTTRNCRPYFALPLAASLFVAIAGAGAVERGPWSVSGAAPVTSEVTGSRGRAGAPVGAEGLLSGAALGLLAFYQSAISPLDGSRCPMQPTCSRYAVEAVRQHGPLAGFILTADRLLHEADEQRLAPRLKIGDLYRTVDPVSANDWWFRR